MKIDKTILKRYVITFMYPREPEFIFAQSLDSATHLAERQWASEEIKEVREDFWR